MSFSCFRGSCNFSTSLFFLLLALAFASNVSFAQINPNRGVTELKKSYFDQHVKGVSVSGFGDSPNLLCILKLNSTSKDAYLSINNDKNLSLTYGVSSWVKFKEISFTGTESQINNALSSLTINTANSDGIIKLQLRVAVNPNDYGFSLQDDRFYKISAGLLDFASKSTLELPVFTKTEYRYKPL
jgi:hypothetical protein